MFIVSNALLMFKATARNVHFRITNAFEPNPNLESDPNYTLNENRETSGMFGSYCVALDMLATIRLNLEEEIGKKTIVLYSLNIITVI